MPAYNTTTAEAGPSTATLTRSTTNTTTTDPNVLGAKIAKNKRLPATMVTPAGTVQPSKVKGRGKATQMSKKQKARSEKGRERAVELSGRLEEKVKGREERKAKRNKAKNAWD